MKNGDLPRYAVYGGSFDPIHLGHVAAAQAVREALELDEVVFVPNNRNPLRRGTYATGQDRLAMIHLAIEDEEGLSLSDIEITRPGRSYTIDTIQELLMVRPGNLWFVMGADSLAGIMEWKQPERLARLCRLAVVNRPGNELNDLLNRLPEEMVDAIDVVEMAPQRASSTMIRDDIAAGRSPEAWLAPKVWDYISERGLYQL